MPKPFFFILPVILFNVCQAKTIMLSPDDKKWFSVLSGPSLNPGDEIILRAGTYSDRRRLEISQRGSAGKPIVIRSAEGAKVIFKRPDARQNTFNLAGCQHLVDAQRLAPVGDRVHLRPRARRYRQIGELFRRGAVLRRVPRGGERVGADRNGQAVRHLVLVTEVSGGLEYPPFAA